MNKIKLNAPAGLRANYVSRYFIFKSNFLNGHELNPTERTKPGCELIFRIPRATESFASVEKRQNRFSLADLLQAKSDLNYSDLILSGRRHRGV